MGESSGGAARATPRPQVLRAHQVWSTRARRGRQPLSADRPAPRACRKAIDREAVKIVRLHRWILAAASWLVPKTSRSEWRAEWEAELHHREAAAEPWTGRRRQRR